MKQSRRKYFRSYLEVFERRTKPDNSITLELEGCVFKNGIVPRSENYQMQAAAD